MNTTSCFCPNSTTGGECQPGEYCPPGSSYPLPCEKGNLLALNLLSIWQNLSQKHREETHISTHYYLRR